MNYLAHVFLSNAPGVMLGNMLGDHVKGPIDRAAVDDFSRGLRLHRKIDAFGDAQIAFRRSRGRLQGYAGRYAGIVVDVLYDYCLRQRWSDYASVPFREFADAAYIDMGKAAADCPLEIRTAIARLTTRDILAVNATSSGINTTLSRIAGRATRGLTLPDITPVLEAQREPLLADFDEFFPSLLALAAELEGHAQHWAHGEIILPEAAND